MYEFYMNNKNNNTRYTLIERLQLKYDEPSWEDFTQIYQKYIYGILHRLGVTAVDSDDVLQQVLIEIWKGVEKYKRLENSRFRSWLSTVTRHTVCRHFRQQKKLSDIPLLILQPELSSPEIEQWIEEEWSKFIATRAMEELKEQFSAAKINVFIASSRGFKDEDIAAEKRIALSSVRVYRSQVQKVLQRVVARLNRDLD
jgi:RNA polymerase sigma factor (sigma-70 family)